MVPSWGCSPGRLVPEPVCVLAVGVAPRPQGSRARGAGGGCSGAPGPVLEARRGGVSPPIWPVKGVFLIDVADCEK